MAEPEYLEPGELRARPGLPNGRVIVASDRDIGGPAFIEWELHAEEWSDEHPHDEYVYVLEGELHVTVGRSTVVGGVGAMVRVPAGARGAYAAPVHARMLSIYGPRPSTPHDAHGVLRRLTGG